MLCDYVSSKLLATTSFKSLYNIATEMSLPICDCYTAYGLVS